MDYIAEKVVEFYNKEFNDDNVKELERKITKLSKELSKIADTFIDAPKALRAILSEKAVLIESQLNDANIDLAKLRIANSIRYTKEHIKIWLKKFTTGDLMDMGFRKRIMDVLLNSAYVFDEKLTLYFNLNDIKLVTFIDAQEDLSNFDDWEAPTRKKKQS